MQHNFNGTLLLCTLINGSLTVGINGMKAYSFDDNREVNLSSNNYSVTSLGDNAFAFCKAKSIFLPSTIHEIGNSCFYNCENIESIDLSKTSIEVLPNHAFDYCTKLKVFLPPPTIVRINDYALGHTAIEELLFNLNLSYLSGCAFYQTYTLKFFESCPVKFPCIDGIIYNAIHTAIISVYPSIKSANYFDTTNILNDMSFSGSLIEEITIKPRIKAINNAAFYNCTHLKSIKFEPGVLYLYSAWASLTHTKLVKFPKTLILLGAGSFAYSEFEEIDLSQTSLVQIPDSCFSNCLYLRKIFFPSSIKEIGSNSFGNSPLIEDIELPKNLINVHPNALENSFIKRINLTNTKLKTIKKHSFVSANLQEVYLPKKLIRIDNQSFSNQAIHFIYTGSKKFDNCSITGNVSVPYDYKYKTFCGVVVNRLEQNSKRPTLFVVE